MNFSPANPAASRPAPGGWVSWAKDLAVLAVVAAIWFCTLIGLRPLSNPDEGRYSEIPREMAVTGDFVTPRLNGVKYFEKPPLVYWLSALTFRCCGFSEFTARLWNGLFATLGVLLTYATARSLYDRRTGIWAAVVLATSLFYLALSQIVILDMAVAVTMSGCLFAFLLAIKEPQGKKRFGLFMAFYVFMALATLSKGLIGIAIPGAVIFFWVLLLNRWKPLWPFYPFVGTAVLLAIAAPWHILAAKANPDFFRFYFIHEHFERFTSRVHGRDEPFWFFIPILVAGMLPWVFYAWQAVRDNLAGGWKSRKMRQEEWFLLIWIVFILAFFSTSQSKLAPYILPVFPAIAVVIGRFVATASQQPDADKLRRGTWVLIGGFLVMAGVALFGPEIKNQPELSKILPVIRVVLAAALLVGVVGGFIGLRRNRPQLILGSVALSFGLVLQATTCAGSRLDRASTKPFAAILKPLLKDGDRVYSVSLYAQDLPVYLNRTIRVADYRGELTFGIEAEPELTADRFPDREGFLKQWQEPGNAYAVIRQTSYDAWFSAAAGPHEVLAATPRFSLVAKKPALP